MIAEACLAKQTAVEACDHVVDQAVQLHGGTGYMHGTEVERHYRDSRILRHRRRSDRSAHRPVRPTVGLHAMTARPTLDATVAETRLSSELRDGSLHDETVRRESMLAKIADLDAQHAVAVAGGGEKYVERHHDARQADAARADRAARRPGQRVPRAVARWPAGARTSRSVPAWSPASA